MRFLITTVIILNSQFGGIQPTHSENVERRLSVIP